MAELRAPPCRAVLPVRDGLNLQRREKLHLKKLEAFFKAVWDEMKLIASDAKAVAVKLFGAQNIAALETAAEGIFASDFGQALLSDSQSVIQDLQAGKITVSAATTAIASTALTAAKSTGIAMEQSMAVMIASMAIAKFQGVLGGLPTATGTATPPASS